MILLYFILLLTDEADDITEIIDQFVGKDIKIYFSAYSHYHLAKRVKNKSSPFIAVSKFINAKDYGFDDRAKINRNGDRYEITLGKDQLCTKDDKNITACEESEANALWKIKKVDFGFTISKDKKCITKRDTEVLVLKPCTSGEDQIVDFKKFMRIDKCDEENIKKKETGEDDKKEIGKEEGKKTEGEDGEKMTEAERIEDLVAMEVAKKLDEIKDKKMEEDRKQKEAQKAKEAKMQAEGAKKPDIETAAAAPPAAQATTKPAVPQILIVPIPIVPTPKRQMPSFENFSEKPQAQSKETSEETYRNFYGLVNKFEKNDTKIGQKRSATEEPDSSKPQKNIKVDVTVKQDDTQTNPNPTSTPAAQSFDEFVGFK